MIIRDDRGVALGNQSVDLPPNGHTQFMLETQFALTVGIRGTVEFDTPPSGQISVLGLRAAPLGAIGTAPNSFAITILPLLANVTPAKVPWRTWRRAVAGRPWWN